MQRLAARYYETIVSLLCNINNMVSLIHGDTQRVELITSQARRDAGLARLDVRHLMTGERGLSNTELQ